MRRFLMLLISMTFIAVHISGQTRYSLSGVVTDGAGNPLAGAAVYINSLGKGSFTGIDGAYSLNGLMKGRYEISISFTGYKTLKDTVIISGNAGFDACLEISTLNLQEVVVSSSYAEEKKNESPNIVDIVNDVYLKQNLGGSLMKSLEKLPGVSSMDIGSGQSKPVIRGLGFYRIAVYENGIKHEAQQWGEEHGLEIDQYAIDRVEVIKGPASIIYGSDAVGGVIDLRQVEIPDANSLGGKIDLTGRSNNWFSGSSVGIYARKEKWFITARATLTAYSDYKVPADSVSIYSFLVPLYRNRLRNTAGNEQDFHLSAGRSGRFSVNRILISNLSSKAGFFANAHGLEPRNVDNILHDRSPRDIIDPYQQVNHFKIVSENEFRFNKWKLEADLGYQKNYREEWSRYVAHGYMPSVFPEDMGYDKELELRFNKDIYTLNMRSTQNVSERISLLTGLSSEYQDNNIGGRAFIIPAYRQFSTGIFLYGKYNISETAFLHAGIRYDNGNMKTNEYHDWFQSPVINQAGDTTGYGFLQRAPSLKRIFNSVCWSVGYNYNLPHLSIKANAGKSFRMPISKELASNGVNYHHFSYETGNPDLKAEISYQIDLGLEWNYPRMALGISPFINYFPNYIYLNPSYKHDYLYGAGNQIFNYTQTEVIRFGGELHFHFKPVRSVQAGLVGEYVFSRQTSGQKAGFTLPFSPPANILLNLKYFSGNSGSDNKHYLSADLILVAPQNKIVPPESKTGGYIKVNLSAGTSLRIQHNPAIVSFQLQNVFNVKYYEHNSYYRRINLPEAGRNFIINIEIPFSFQTNGNKLLNK